jgi:hypothetical protein
MSCSVSIPLGVGAAAGGFMTCALRLSYIALALTHASVVARLDRATGEAGGVAGTLGDDGLRCGPTRAEQQDQQQRADDDHAACPADR